MTIRKVIAAFQIVCLVFLNLWNLPLAVADDSDIFGNNISPNVLIALDTSGSMLDETGTLIPYSSGTSYTPVAYRGSTLVTTTVYRRRTGGSVGSPRIARPASNAQAASAPGMDFKQVTQIAQSASPARSAPRNATFVPV